jgi:6-phosphofructokinase
MCAVLSADLQLHGMIKVMGRKASHRDLRLATAADTLIAVVFFVWPGQCVRVLWALCCALDSVPKARFSSS